MQKPIKIAYGSVPKGSGTYTFYRNLRPRLLEKGIDLRCVSVGKQQCRLWNNAFADAGCVKIAADTNNVREQSQVFVAWCIEQEVDIVIGINSIAILSALDHLPQSIRVLSRCAAGFDHGYRITLSGMQRLSAIVATSPRLRDELVNHYHADPALVHLIPNGIEPSGFNPRPDYEGTRSDEHGSVLRIVFLGRLENKHKGVFHIPHIVEELKRRQIDFKLQIAGQGVEEKRLKRAMRSDAESGCVEFLGEVSPDRVPGLLLENSLLLFPSSSEGCPNVLLEAMMAGCVPVAWIIPGITDFIVDNGSTGDCAP